ncbi:uncharacterized protein G2W53_000619 [Senna tora]|uniref:Uncharacterized protein n=1 Tax=Senna tora TaxID=362788 RepID=A0A834XE93_9FABA|nr:uncharacterized protein G2W53_000619 [Senna tora]
MDDALSSSITLADTSGAISDDVTKLHSPCAMTSSSPSLLPLPPALPMSCFAFLALQAISAVVLSSILRLQMVTRKATTSSPMTTASKVFLASVSIAAALSLPPHSKAPAPPYADCLLSRTSSSIVFMDVFKHTITVAAFKDAAAHAATKVVKLTSASTASLPSFSPFPPSPPPPLPPLPDRHPVARIFICDEDAGEMASVSSLPPDEVFIIRFVDMKAQPLNTCRTQNPYNAATTAYLTTPLVKIFFIWLFMMDTPFYFLPSPENVHRKTHIPLLPILPPKLRIQNFLNSSKASLITTYAFMAFLSYPINAKQTSSMPRKSAHFLLTPLISLIISILHSLINQQCISKISNSLPSLITPTQPNQLSIYDPSKHPFAPFSTPHNNNLFNLYYITSFIPSNHHLTFITISISHSSTTSMPPQAYHKRNLNYPSNATSCNGRANVVSSEDTLLFASNLPDPH